MAHLAPPLREYFIVSIFNILLFSVVVGKKCIEQYLRLQDVTFELLHKTLYRIENIQQNYSNLS